MDDHQLIRTLRSVGMEVFETFCGLCPQIAILGRLLGQRTHLGTKLPVRYYFGTTCPILGQSAAFWDKTPFGDKAYRR